MRTLLMASLLTLSALALAQQQAPQPQSPPQQSAEEQAKQKELQERIRVEGAAGGTAPVPEVEPGVICLRVRCTSEQEDGAGRQLQQTGAVNVKKL